MTFDEPHDAHEAAGAAAEMVFSIRQQEFQGENSTDAGSTRSAPSARGSR